MGEDRAEEFGERNGVAGELVVRVRPTKIFGEAQRRRHGRYLTPADAIEPDDRAGDRRAAGRVPPRRLSARDPRDRPHAARVDPPDRAGTVETVRPGWRWIAYSLPDGRRVRNFAWIGPERKHIHLGFEHGTLLADPDHVLHGAEERLRKFRYFTFEPAIDVDEAILVDFLRGPRTSRRCRRSARRALAETSARAGGPARDGDPLRHRGRARRPSLIETARDATMRACRMRPTTSPPSAAAMPRAGSRSARRGSP